MFDTNFTTRECSILMLLELLGDVNCEKRAHELVDDIYRYSKSTDPALNEIRLLKVALSLIDYGGRILASTTLSTELRSIIAELILEIDKMDIEGIIRTTQQAEYAANMVEIAITGNWNILPKEVQELDSVKKLVASAKKSLARMPIYHDMGNPILLLSDEELSKIGISNCGKD